MQVRAWQAAGGAGRAAGRLQCLPPAVPPAGLNARRDLPNSAMLNAILQWRRWRTEGARQFRPGGTSLGHSGQ